METLTRGSNGSRGGNARGGPGGKGRKNEANKAAERAKLAAFLAGKYGASSKLGASAMNAAHSTSDDVEIMGEKTRAERDAELRDEAVSVEDAC